MPKAPARTPWTFLVYMAGDNDLDPSGVSDLREMKRIGSTDAVNIVAQFDRSKPHRAKRYYLTKGTRAEADVVQDVGKIDTGNPKNLTGFVKWAVGKYPAERYILVLWNHGEGWDDTDLWPRHRGRLRRLAAGPVRHTLFRTPVRRLVRDATRDPASRAILIDDNAKNFLDNHEMKAVLAAITKRLGRKLDVLGLDACLMSMAEVGYQCRGGAAYTVGSTETEPLQGWPYDTILRALIRAPAMTGRELSRLIVRKYMDSYRGDQVTQSACDLAAAPALASAVRMLAQALAGGLRNSSVVDQIRRARDQVQYYDIDDNIDLADFCDRLMQVGTSAAVRRACREVIRVVQEGYVLAAGAKGPELRHSQGVAIYFPRGPVSPLYAGLSQGLPSHGTVAYDTVALKGIPYRMRGRGVAKRALIVAKRSYPTPGPVHMFAVQHPFRPVMRTPL
jgi:hypothetical protein